MKKKIIFGSLMSFLLLLPLWAQWGGIRGGGDLGTKINTLTNSVLSVILPAVSILGLVYAAILAAMGDQTAKSRMVLIIVACIMGLFAPVIIAWLKSIAGVGV